MLNMTPYQKKSVTTTDVDPKAYEKWATQQNENLAALNERWRLIKEEFGNVYDGFDSYNENFTSISDAFKIYDKNFTNIDDNLLTIATAVDDNTTKAKSLDKAFKDLESLVGDFDPSVDVGDVSGLDDVIKNLKGQYDTAETSISGIKQNLSDYQTDLTDQFDTFKSDVGTSTKEQLDAAIKGLGMSDYLKESDFDERMSDQLDTLSKTLSDDFGKQIEGLNLSAIGKAISSAEGDLSDLSKDFAGISEDVSYLKDLDLGKFDDRLDAQATSFGNLLGDQATSFGELLGDQATSFGDLLGTQSTNLQELIGDAEGRAETARGELAEDISGDFETAAKAREQLGKDLTSGFKSATTAREQLEKDLASGLKLGSEGRQDLADALAAQGYDIEDLSTQLAGYGDDLADYQEQFQGDLTDLRGSVGTARELALGKLEKQIGKDRAADLIDLKKSIDEGTASEIEKVAANLRQEYGDDLFDLSDTFDTELGTVKDELGADIQDLFGKSLEQDTAVAGLTTDVGTLGQNLESLKTAYGDYKLDAATNLGNVRRALESEIGDVGTSLTEGLSDIKTDYLDRILGAQESGATARAALASDLTKALSGEATARQEALATEAEARAGLRSDLLSSLGTEAALRQAGLTSEAEARRSDLATAAEARQGLRSDLTEALSGEATARETGLATEAEARRSGLATEAEARRSGLATEASARESGLQLAEEARSRLAEEASRGFQDVYKTREQAISDLSGRFGENLRAQETSLGKRIDETARTFDEKVGRLGSMMNYRMLGDSAGGVKMRRSKAYKSGAVGTGTSQLSRSMKLKTLNL